ncbi:hypothetical protein [Alkalihalobacillus sp. TS-13]|uniref:hypothetical protein n=1 Tax=Alkalihalobacillus sp. TS-13 TaxID=2842455 RepID=UPI001C876747|nr:hypothetical protein [Alkalihalobacillus sp. TS-13]
MKVQDQASILREKVNNDEIAMDNDEVDILNLPPRSEKHSRSKGQTKEATQPDKTYLWITRGIAIAFICMIVFIVYYLTYEMPFQEIKKDGIQPINIVN